MKDAENNIKQDLNFMTCTEVAELLRVKVGTIYSWISYKQIDKSLYRKLGRKPIFIKENVISWFINGAILKPRHSRKGADD